MIEILTYIFVTKSNYTNAKQRGKSGGAAIAYSLLIMFALEMVGYIFAAVVIFPYSYSTFAPYVVALPCLFLGAWITNQMSKRGETTIVYDRPLYNQYNQTSGAPYGGQPGMYPPPQGYPNQGNLSGPAYGFAPGQPDSNSQQFGGPQQTPPQGAAFNPDMQQQAWQPENGQPQPENPQPQQNTQQADGPSPILSTPSTVIINRDKKFANSVWAYSFELNGMPIGKLKSGQSLTATTNQRFNTVVDISPFGARGPEVRFEALDGGRVELYFDTTRIDPRRTLILPSEN